MDAKRKIEALQIPKAAVAELAGVTPPELSKYIRNEKLISKAKAQRIRTTVDDVELLLKAGSLMPGLPSFDFSDTNRIRAAIERLKLALQNCNPGPETLDTAGMHRLLVEAQVVADVVEEEAAAELDPIAPQFS